MGVEVGWIGWAGSGKEMVVKAVRDALFPAHLGFEFGEVVGFEAEEGYLDAVVISTFTVDVESFDQIVQVPGGCNAVCKLGSRLVGSDSGSFDSDKMRISSTQVELSKKVFESVSNSCRGHMDLVVGWLRAVSCGRWLGDS